MARFSMIEMIAVMVVVTIMLVIAGPTFTQMTNGNAVEAAVRDVGTSIHLARQQALARRRYVALIMPGPLEDALGISEDDRYTVHRLAYVNSALEFQGWVENRKWEFLAPGASIMEVDDDVGISSDGNAPDRQPTENSPAQIDNVDLTALGGAADVDGVRALVFSPAGKLLENARYVTIGAALKKGGTWIIRNVAATSTNVSCSNQFTIEINRYTGGLRYIQPADYSY